MSIEIIQLVFSAQTGSSSTKVVLLALANRANKDGGDIFPSVRRLSQETDLCERAVRSALSSLREMGVLVKVKEGYGTTPARYQIVIKALHQMHPCIKCTPAPNAPLPLHQMPPTPAPNAPLTVLDKSIEPSIYTPPISSPQKTKGKSHDQGITTETDRRDTHPNRETPAAPVREPETPKAEPWQDIALMMKFNEFWDLCPNKSNLSKCRDEFFQHMKNGVPAEKIIDGIRRYRAYIDAGLENPRYVKGSLKWLQERHWTNPYITEKKDEQPKRIRGLVV